MKGRIALVTGGMGDIGTAICQYFREMGARAIAADRVGDTAKQDHEFVRVDVTQFDDCQRMAAEVEERFGPIDILVNGAGTIHDVTLRKMTQEQWNDVVHTDLDSMFNVTRQFVNGMMQRRYGRIINISSVNAQKGQFGQTNYASAKAGVFGFTKSLAQEVAKHGITVNAISPGLVKSKMVSTIPADILKKMLSDIPIGRLASVDEIAWAVGFLASEKSAYITGANLAVNGGLYM